MGTLLLVLLAIVVAYFAFRHDLSLKEAMGSGFTKEFRQANLWPGQCICSDGSLGRFYLGGKGDCVCGDNIDATVRQHGLVPPPAGNYSNASMLWPFRDE